MTERKARMHHAYQTTLYMDLCDLWLYAQVAESLKGAEAGDEIRRGRPATLKRLEELKKACVARIKSTRSRSQTKGLVATIFGVAEFFDEFGASETANHIRSQDNHVGALTPVQLELHSQALTPVVRALEQLHRAINVLDGREDERRPASSSIGEQTEQRLQVIAKKFFLAGLVESIDSTVAAELRSGAQTGSKMFEAITADVERGGRAELARHAYEQLGVAPPAEDLYATWESALDRLRFELAVAEKACREYNPPESEPRH